MKSAEQSRYQRTPDIVVLALEVLKQEVEGGGGKAFDVAFAVVVVLEHLCVNAVRSCDSDPDRAFRVTFVSTTRTCEACCSYRIVAAGKAADSVCHGCGNFAAYYTVLENQQRRNSEYILLDWNGV